VNLELVDHDDLGEIASRVNDEYALMTGDMTRAVQRAIRIGELLTQAKADVAHGEWLPWIQQNLVFSERHARKYMQVYANRSRVADLGASSLREAVALLAEPKDEPAESEDVQTSAPTEPQRAPDITPVLDEDPDPVPEYRNDPELERALKAATEREKMYAAKIEASGRAIAEKERELAKLRKLEADKERVETALRDLQRLEARKTELFKDAESTKVVHQTLVRSREFFTRECMQIPALKLRPESVRVMKQDFEGLVELVENWLEAVKERFL
jgi:hypothetical protein